MKLKYALKYFLLILMTFFSLQLYAQPPMSDAAITSNVKAKIMADKLVNNLNVNVRTEKQVVYFDGEVNSESEASTLVQLAQSTVDVKDVDTSKLTVKGSDHPLTDSYITAKVKGEFLREKLFGDKEVSVWSIKVETTDGIVYLTGETDSKKQAENAVKLAQGIAGVKEVKYRIKTLKGAKIAYDYTNY
jgi:hyperosmotically inducible protein